MRLLALLLLTLFNASFAATTYPNGMASGHPTIGSALTFTGSTTYVTLGQPSALTSILTPTHEFTILARMCRTNATSTGAVIALANSTTTEVELSSQGGSSYTGNIGGTTFTTGTGSVVEPTWDAVALINRNASGTFMASILLDDNARSTEVASGATTIAGYDVMIGGRRNSTNADAAAIFNGTIDCIVIWNYALTDDQIHSAMAWINPNDVLFQSYNGTNYQTGLVAYWPMNEGSGTTINDCQQGLNGTIIGGGNLWQTSTFSKPPISVVGDSLTTSAGSPHSYGDEVFTGGSGLRNGRICHVYGFPGQACAYIATQLALPAYTPFLTWTQIYLVGIHDLGSPSTVLSFLSNEIATLPHSRYLIIGNRAYGSTGVSAGVGNPAGVGIGDWGTTIRGQIDAMNLAEQAVYGWRFLDEQTNSVSLNSIPGNNDSFQLRTPCNICSDATHMLEPGYVGMSQLADQLATACGW